MTFARTSAWLVDERWAKAYPLGDRTTIGRGPESTIILRDSAVSRLHAELSKEGEVFVLRALGSSGTKVNGQRVGSEWALREGDVIEIAFTSLRFTARAPTNEMFVIPRDVPTPRDTQEGPTQAAIRAISQSEIVAASRRGWRRFWYWLTRRANTE
jgi:pSer/pThr/pTyr-binding forkhead associated (FHA) protein